MIFLRKCCNENVNLCKKGVLINFIVNVIVNAISSAFRMIFMLFNLLLPFNVCSFGVGSKR